MQNLKPDTFYSRCASNVTHTGFTLLEVLVALAISGVVLMVVLQLFSTNMSALFLSKEYVYAVMAAEAKMREVTDDDDLATGSWQELTSDGYRIDVDVKKSQQEKTQNLKLDLLEIDVKIHWTEGAKERSFALKTMKVVNKKI